MEVWKHLKYEHGLQVTHAGFSFPADKKHKSFDWFNYAAPRVCQEADTGKSEAVPTL